MLFEIYVEDVLSRGTELPVRLVQGGIARTAFDERVDDVEVPTFTLLRAQLGLPWGDERWWPAGGRHLAAAPDLPAVEVSHPTVALLERTLAGLRAWDAYAGG